MRPVTQTYTLQAASTTFIRAAASISGAGALTLAKSATTDTLAHLLSFTSAGDDSGITFTVVGYDGDGRLLSDVVTGANTTVTYSAKYFKTITSITASGASAGNVSIGVAAPAITPQVIGDYTTQSSSVTALVTGTINYTVQYSNSFSKLMDLTATPIWISHSDTDVVAATTNKTGSAVTPVCAMRTLINSYTSTPTIEIVYIWARNV